MELFTLSLTCCDITKKLTSIALCSNAYPSLSLFQIYEVTSLICEVQNVLRHATLHLHATFIWFPLANFFCDMP